MTGFRRRYTSIRCCGLVEPLRNRPLAGGCPERLLAIPLEDRLVAFLAVAHQAAGDQVFAHGQATVDLRHHMIKGWATAKWITAIGTFIVPSEVDLITGGAPGDQARLINVVLIH